MTCTTTSQCTGGQVCIGGNCDDAVLLLAGSATSLLTGSFRTSAGWTTGTLSDKTSFAPSLTFDDTGRALGVYTSATGGAVSSAVWANGSWGSPAAIDASATARSQPYADATGGAVTHLVYQDSSYYYWYTAFTGTWSAPQQVGTASNQYYGPFAPTIAALGSNATTSFFDGMTDVAQNSVTTSDLVGGVFQTKLDISGTLPNIVTNPHTPAYVIPTAIVSLSGGAQQMLIYVDVNSRIMFTTRPKMGSWSSPVYINNCLTNDPVALAPLSGGDAILAFRGQDTNLYWTVYSGSSWSVVAPFASPNVSVDTSPAVTHGIGSHVAEVAYVSGGKAYHASLTGSTWSAPVMVGGTSLTGVAIAAAP